MKPETYVGIALLLLFVAASAFAIDVMMYVTYVFGCFAVGWFIPDVSKYIVDKFQRKEVV
jgi:hypothetical protein